MQTASGTHPQPPEEDEIVNIWKHNLEDEFMRIRVIVQKFPCISMDTEFPGVVARPRGEFRSASEYQYQLLRCNVDMLKIIQLGITFFDLEGNKPDKGPCTWQFNFRFNLEQDMYAQDSIELLNNSGMDFKRHEEEGIEIPEIAELLISSGLVLCDNVAWITFHSGYDFGYLLRLLTCQNLPAEESEFFDLLRLYFPKVYDVKYIMKSCKNLKGGLQEVADTLVIERIGEKHQAGSDSNLTGAAFFRMKQMFFEGEIDDEKYNGHLYGLGPSFITGSTVANTTGPGTSAVSVNNPTNNQAD
ncbi:CCR4-NOT transcription complex subunit 7 [Oopsacas minuta]|uniref:poly(A)-specific ribonuclease n=1 Tax=Oopsacas minuta TaxID=111878 RepID=A0AAV7JUB5_9METZ|nr:CCR4-NOT transcription complex subunit 7 [Oopsacas minuta]